MEYTQKYEKVKYTIILTSWKEPISCYNAIFKLSNSAYSGIIPQNTEIIQVSPDDETLKSGMKAIKESKYPLDNYIQIKDPQKGKPYAMRLAFGKARGEIIIMTDGDVYIGKHAIKYLLEPFCDDSIIAVTGHPIFLTKDSRLWNFNGYLQERIFDKYRKEGAEVIQSKVDDAGFQYSKDILNDATLTGSYFIHRNRENPLHLSGYLYAVRNIPEVIDIPENTIVEDGYISYMVHSINGNYAYADNATVFVIPPQSFRDLIKQKKRSQGGYEYLKNIDKFRYKGSTRGFLRDAKAGFYYLTIIRNPIEIVYLLAITVARIYMWVLIIYEHKIKKEYEKGKLGWERIESTK